MEKKKIGKALSPYTAFLVFNAVFFMMDTVNSYFNIYLDQLGFTKTMIGTVTGVGYLAAMLCQPTAGAWLDRSASRTRMLQILIGITALLYPLLLLNSGFGYILCLHTVYLIFRRLQPAVNTALTVEFAERNGRDYGPIRMMGAIGYTLMMTLVSWVAGRENGAAKTFWLYSVICLGNILLLFLLPPMPGHSTRRGRLGASSLKLLKNRGVALLILYHVLIATANGIGSAYFPIFAANDMGAGNALYGVMVTVGSMLEIPFLFLADRIIRRLGMRKTVFALGILTAVRWGNAYFALSAGQLFITQGFNFVNILEGVTVAILISRLVLPEAKTAVQTLSASIQGIVGILISTFGGGVLADLFGIRPLFLIAAVIAVGTAVLFLFLLRKEPAETGLQ
jgi:PPP family 3-phenylpropionic acid transporter